MTPAIQAYLAAARDQRMLLVTVILTLTTHYRLTPQEAGMAIARDLQENA